MKVEQVLWARKTGAEEWQEEMITSTSDPAHLAKAKEWAKQNGFVSFRVSEFRQGDRPDFVGAIRK